MNEGGLKQSSVSYKKSSEFTADEKYEHALMNAMRVAKARLAVVQRNIAEPASSVVARLDVVEKVARESAQATARQQN